MRLAPWALLFGLAAAAADGPPQAPAAPAAPAHPFAAWLAGLRPAAPIRLPGLTVVPLDRPGPYAPSAPLRVTLRGADVRWLDLPEPAGDLYVRVENRGDTPIEVTTGEALLTAGGPSRVIVRPAYVAPRSAALLATALMEPAVTGPYAARGLGLTPREQELLGTTRWRAALEARNRFYGADPQRLADATAAYLSEGFQQRAAPLEERLAPLEGPQRVGVAVLDERGLSWVRLAADPERFARHAGLLRLALALDALEAQRAGRTPQALEGAPLEEALRSLLRVLEGEGTTRAAPGGGLLTWWVAPARRGRWEGLAAGAAPLSLTWRLDAPPEPVPVVAPPAQQPQPEQPAQTPPTPNQVGRDPRPTPLDERLRERREGGGGGGLGPGVGPPFR